MKHIKLFENFTVEKDLFTQISEEEYEERNTDSDKFDTNSQILRYLNVLKSKYNSYLEADSMIVDIIEKRRDGTYGLKLTINLADDDWFIVRMDEYEWVPYIFTGPMGSWRRREVNDDYTEPSYWKCDHIEGLISFIDTVKEDIWGFLTR